MTSLIKSGSNLFLRKKVAMGRVMVGGKILDQFVELPWRLVRHSPPWRHRRIIHFSSSWSTYFGWKPELGRGDGDTLMSSPSWRRCSRPRLVSVLSVICWMCAYVGGPLKIPGTERPDPTTPYDHYLIKIEDIKLRRTLYISYQVGIMYSSCYLLPLLCGCRFSLFCEPSLFEHT